MNKKRFIKKVTGYLLVFSLLVLMNSVNTVKAATQITFEAYDYYLKDQPILGGSVVAHVGEYPNIVKLPVPTTGDGQGGYSFYLLQQEDITVPGISVDDIIGYYFQAPGYMEGKNVYTTGEWTYNFSPDWFPIPHEGEGNNFPITADEYYEMTPMGLVDAVSDISELSYWFFTDSYVDNEMVLADLDNPITFSIGDDGEVVMRIQGPLSDPNPQYNIYFYNGNNDLLGRTFFYVNDFNGDGEGEFTHPIDNDALGSITTFTGNANDDYYVGGVSVSLYNKALGWYNPKIEDFQLDWSEDCEFLNAEDTAGDGSYSTWLLDVSGFTFPEGQYIAYLSVLDSEWNYNVDRVMFSTGQLGIPPIKNDINGDGQVNQADLVAIAAKYNATGRYLPWDLNDDVVVDILDIILVAKDMTSE